MNIFIRNYANIPNPITKFFNKIYFVELDKSDYIRKIKLLEAMKKVPLYLKHIKISSINSEQLENLTDPNLHNTQISNLILKLKSCNFSSKTIENLKTICPNLITLYCNSFEKDDFKNQVYFENFTELLSNLDHTSLEMRSWENDYSLKLEFNDAILKVVGSNEECSYIRTKSVEIRWAVSRFSRIE